MTQPQKPTDSQLAAELGGKRVLLVTDPGLVKAGHAARVQESLTKAGLHVSLFDRAKENPTTKCVDECVAVAAAGLAQEEHRQESRDPHDATSHHPFTDAERWAAVFDSPDRDEWQKPAEVTRALGLRPGMIVADLGAGGGWFTVRLARRVGPNGLVYAQDIQQEMIDVIRRRLERENLRNVHTVLGTATDSRLPRGLDAILIVNSYHEMDDPGKIGRAHV